MSQNIVSIKWVIDTNDKIIDAIKERDLTYLEYNNIIILNLPKNDPWFRKFKISPSKYKTRTYYLTNDDMLIYKIKKEEHPFIHVSIINNYNNFKYVISFFSRLPISLHTLYLQEIFKKENYKFENDYHVYYLSKDLTVEHTKNSMSFIKEFNNGENIDYLTYEGNFLINYLDL